MGGTTNQIVSVTLANVNDAPVIGGLNTGTVAEDVDPDADTLLETSGTLSIADPDAGESAFVAETVSGSHGYLVIDASGNWDYVADNTQASVQQLDAGESVNDVLTVTTADGTSHNVTVTINGGEDASVVGGITNGAVVEDDALVANGPLSITDVDTSDNPVSFPDATSVPGDNGYGDFQLTAGNWTYTLDNANAAVQALGAGGNLTDSHTFLASDGSVQMVTVLIAGAAESTPPMVEPLLPEPTREPSPAPVERPASPPEVQAPVEPAVEVVSETEPEPQNEPSAGRTDPSTGESEVDAWPAVASGPSEPVPLEPDEIFLSILADARPHDGPVVKKTSPIVAKPTAEAAQTFLQELKSFWTEDSTASSIEMSEVRLNKDFWDGLDRMSSDLDESLEAEERKAALSTEAAAGVGISMTAGFVSWALRAGSMAASFLTAMPTWRHFDPMPILGADEKKRQGAVEGDNHHAGENEHADEEQRLDDVFDRD